ncbi:MAG: hypothetical protein WD036_05410 [Bauldia sp.]
MRRVLVVVCATVVCLPAALAAPNCQPLLQQGCACAVPIDLSGKVGDLSGASENVVVNGQNGYGPTSAAVPLNVGASVIVPDNGRALFTAGPECSRELAARSNLVIREMDGCACIVQVDADIDVEATTGQIAAGLGLAGLLAGGGLVTFFALQAGDSISP